MGFSAPPERNLLSGQVVVATGWVARCNHASIRPRRNGARTAFLIPFTWVKEATRRSLCRGFAAGAAEVAQGPRSGPFAVLRAGSAALPAVRALVAPQTGQSALGLALQD